MEHSSRKEGITMAFYHGVNKRSQLITRSLDPISHTIYVRLGGAHHVAFQYCALACMEARRAPLYYQPHADGSATLAFSLDRSALRNVITPLACKWGLQTRELDGILEEGRIFSTTDLDVFPIPTIILPHQPRLAAHSWAVAGSDWYVALDTPDGIVAQLLDHDQIASYRYPTHHAHLTYFCLAPLDSIKQRGYYLYFERRQIPIRRALGLPYGQTPLSYTKTPADTTQTIFSPEYCSPDYSGDQEHASR